MVVLPGGGTVRIDYTEEIALLLLLHGGYEVAELESIGDFAKPGSVVVDVGANIGIYTVALASLVGASGKVLALEPVPRTVDKLRANIAMNGLMNVEVLTTAAGEESGSVVIKLASDSAYASTVQVKHERATGEVLTTAVTTLDEIWRQQGQPMITFCKIDVEGAELSVLKGSEALLRSCHPTLLLEADPGPQLDSIISWLAPRGFSKVQPVGFSAWNHLFVWRQS